MSVPENGYSPYYEAAPESSSEGQRTLFHYRDLLLRKWPVIVGAGMLGLLIAVWMQRDATTVYSADATVQRQRESTPVFGLTSGGGGDVSLASEIEIMRTTSLLGPVVDSLGLRLRVVDDPMQRGPVFREIRINRATPGNEFRLTASGEELRLATAAGRVVATARDAEVLSGEGFLLTVDGERVREAVSVRFVIEPWESTMTRLLRRLEVGALDGTDLIRIEYRSEDPVLAAAVPNAVAEAYQAYAANQARMEATRRKEFLQGRLNTVADSLVQAQAELLEFQAVTQTVNPRSEGEALSQMLRSEEQRLRQFTNDERTLQNLLTSFEAEGEGDEALRQMVVLSGDFFPSAQALYNRLQELDTRRSTLTASPLVGRTANDPQVQIIDSLINVTKLEMRATAGQTLQLLRERRADVAQRVEELERQVGDVPERNTAFGRLQQRVEAIQRHHDVLAEKYYEAQITEAVEAGNVDIVELARVPSEGLPMNRLRNLLLGLLGGLVLGTVLASLQEQLDTRVKDGSGAARVASSELIGVIPALASANGNRRVLVKQGRDLEAFRMLRTNLRFVRAERPRTIMVTSPEPGDGKSLVIANLALAHAREGVRVLVVDADLRRPVQHEIFSVPREPGLSDILVGDASTGAVKPVRDGKLSLLSAGSAVPHPPELLGSDAFSRLIERALERYDVIFVDAPPILAVTDTSVMASQVDGVILVARFGKTDQRALVQAANQLRRTGCEVLGLVMNDIPNGRRAGSYDYRGYHDSYQEYYSSTDESSGARVGKDV